MKFFLSYLFVFTFGISYCQNPNRPVPGKQLFPYEFKLYRSLPSKGYFLSAPLKLDLKPENPYYISPKPIILDNKGYVYWYMDATAPSTSDFKYFPRDSLFGFIRTKDGVSAYFLMDLNFNLIDSFFNVNNVRQDAHEFIRLRNGNYIIGGTKDSIMDLSGLTFNGKRGGRKTVVRGYVIQEFNQKCELVFQWNSNYHIHPKESFETYGYDSTKYDYAHGNSIEEDVDGNLVVSLRYLNAVYKVNHQTGKIIWQLGGKASNFTFINDKGFSGQHDVRVLNDGSLSLFDNANTASEPKISRGVQYKIDLLKKTATKVWEYSCGCFVKGMGGYQVINTNNHLINYGLSFRPNPSVVLVDKDRKLGATITFKDSVMSYRTVYHEIPFKAQHGKIVASKIAGNYVMVAPEGHKKYQWSNGDTTQIIVTNVPGKYQVWMDHGIGMIGSEFLDVSPLIANSFSLVDENNKSIATPLKGQKYWIKSKSLKKEINWK